MDKFRLALPFFVLDVQSTSLVICTVTCTGNFTVFIFSLFHSHPGFEIIFSVCWTTEISCWDIDDTVCKPESVTNFLLNVQKFCMEGFTFFRFTEDEHFELCKLVNTIQSFTFSSI